MTDTTVPAAQDDLLARSSWARMKAAHRNSRVSTRLTVRGDLMDTIALLEEEMRREDEIDQWQNRTPIAPVIARRIQELEAQAREHEVLFTFEGLGQGAFAKLQAAHPATAEIKADLGRDDLDWHPETFPPALLAASCVEPVELRGNVAEWTEIYSTWSQGQAMRLWGTCMTANAMGADTPKSARASEILRRIDSANNSTTALL